MGIPDPHAEEHLEAHRQQQKSQQQQQQKSQQLEQEHIAKRARLQQDEQRVVRQLALKIAAEHAAERGRLFSAADDAAKPDAQQRPPAAVSAAVVDPPASDAPEQDSITPEEAVFRRQFAEIEARRKALKEAKVDEPRTDSSRPPADLLAKVARALTPDQAQRPAVLLDKLTPPLLEESSDKSPEAAALAGVGVTSESASGMPLAIREPEGKSRRKSGPSWQERVLAVMSSREDSDNCLWTHSDVSKALNGAPGSGVDAKGAVNYTLARLLELKKVDRVMVKGIWHYFLAGRVPDPSAAADRAGATMPNRKLFTCDECDFTTYHHLGIASHRRTHLPRGPDGRHIPHQSTRMLAQHNSDVPVSDLPNGTPDYDDVDSDSESSVGPSWKRPRIDEATMDSPMPAPSGMGISARKRTPRNEVIRAFACDFPGCDKSYGAKGSLKQHQSLKHGQQKDGWYRPTPPESLVPDIPVHVQNFDHWVATSSPALHNVAFNPLWRPASGDGLSRTGSNSVGPIKTELTDSLPPLEPAEHSRSDPWLSQSGKTVLPQPSISTFVHSGVPASLSSGPSTAIASPVFHQPGTVHHGARLPPDDDHSVTTPTASMNSID
eukprot:TRINITY_DN2849_c0_g1_i1.p1 TRINITY_DN2849_c0_g1~~TRINITY_DN2849_c0_g1_i1.p1  ORF type:complete len:607 (+),score=130.38 TRINITY_DN2849_c0_g1_i1:138-1958(+)